MSDEIIDTAADESPYPPPGQPAKALTLTKEQMRETIDQLRCIREFIYSELKDGLDYGKVQGCGDKPVLLQPGAQKICLFLNVYPDYTVQRRDLDHGHVEYIVNTALVSRTTAVKVASGLGSATTLEKKHRYRRQDRVCPKCGAETIRSSKTGGFFCGVRNGGCGASFAAGDPAIVNQKVGLVENEDVADSYNTVLKMAKKRSFVDATISLSCIAEFFTQDLEDRGEVQPAGPIQPYNSDRRPPADAAPVTSDWRDHPQVAEYNRLFEELVQESGTYNTDREPAFRAFVKNEWVKLTRSKDLEARPDRIPEDRFAEVSAECANVVRKAIKERTTGVKAKEKPAPTEWHQHPHVLAYQAKLDELMKEAAVSTLEHEARFRTNAHRSWEAICEAEGMPHRCDQIPAGMFPAMLDRFETTVRRRLQDETA